MNEKELAEELTPEEEAALADMQADPGEPETAEMSEASDQMIEPEAKTDPEPEGGAQELEPEPEAADPEPERADEGEGDGKPPPGYVPHGALHQEREKNKALAQQIAELQEWKAEQEKAQKPAPEPEPEMPDPVVDPDGFRDWYAKREAARGEQIEAVQRQHREAAQRAQVLNAFGAQGQAFQARQPDYLDAAQHAQEMREAELRFMNPAATDEQIRRTVAVELEQFAAGQIANGGDAAAALYEYAKIRGYRPPEPEQKAAPAEAKRLEAQKAAQEATQGLANVSPDAGAGGLTLERLSRMSEAEIAKLEREDPAAIERALGGAAA